MSIITDFPPVPQTKCCDPQEWSSDKFENVFCQIDQALTQCLSQYPGFALDNIFFEGYIGIRWPGYPQHDHVDKINIDWMGLVKDYRRCRNGPPALSDAQIKFPTTEGASCQSRPKPPAEQKSAACKRWASALQAAQTQIQNLIQHAVLSTCTEQQRNNLFPDPEIKFGSRCGRKHYDKPDDLPFIIKPIFEDVPPEEDDDNIRKGDANNDPPNPDA